MGFGQRGKVKGCLTDMVSMILLCARNDMEVRTLFCASGRENERST